MGIFSRKRRGLEAEHDEAMVVDTTQIGHLFTRMQDEHARLSVRIDDHTERFQSMVLKVSPHLGRLALDQMYPDSGRTLVKVGSRLHATTRLTGIETRFGVIIDAIKAHEDGDIYQAAIPPGMLYYQRRAAFRATVPPEVPLAHSLITDPGGASVRAKLVDVSATGIGAMLMGDPQLHIGEVLNCDLHLPHGHLMTEVEIRSMSKILGHSRIGALFTELSPTQRILIQRTIAGFQRVTIRRKTQAA